MSIELSGGAGQFVVEETGILSFMRARRCLLQTTVVPAFCEIYGVNFPLTVPKVSHQAGSLLISYTIQATLITHPTTLTIEVRPTEVGFRLMISAPLPVKRVGFNFNLKSAGSWYGLGERVIQGWPLESAGVISDPYLPHDHGRDGTLNLASPLFLTQSGVGILLEEAPGDFFVDLNPGSDGVLELGIAAPESRLGADLDTSIKPQGPSLVLNVVLATDTTQATRQSLKLLGHPVVPPPSELWSKPIWTTWARHKMAVTQQDVLAYAEEIIARDYPRSVMEIDDRWQTAYGDLAFDPKKFPDPAAMVARLHEGGFRVTLWVTPFFNPNSAAFVEAARQGFLVRERVTGQPILTYWWQGIGGLIDVTNPAALEWWRAGLQRLQTEYGIDGFKFDGGEASFLPAGFQTYLPIERRTYPDYYVAWVAANFSWTEVRSGWRSQRQGLFFRQWDKWSRWGLDNGLHSVLTQALTMSVIGYPFILPDIIGGNAYGGEEPDAELLIRWTQLTALLPAMQFSIAPWSFDEATNQICRYYVQLHQEFAPYIQQRVDETIQSGTPLIRPLFWHTPDDLATYAINDQFMLGEDLLVAPVVQPHVTLRDIYLPRGSWRDYWHGEVYKGPQWLKAYPAPLENLPLFERVKSVEK